MTTFNPDELFNGIAQFVSDSQALLLEGGMMEIAGLDDRVRELCEAVLELSQEERVRYADRLQQLLGDLNALGEALVVQRDAVSNELQGLSHHRKANTAYRIVEASDGHKGEE